MNASSRNSSAIPPSNTTRVPAWAVAVVILAIGVAIGYLFRGQSSKPTPAGPNSNNQPAESVSSTQSQARLEAAVKPMLDRLKEDPNNAALLVNIGNEYYDNHDWNKAIEYYRKSLRIQPANADVRTDMGTAIWYGGDPQGAIREYETALKYQPDYPQTLFNMGVVQWQGEHKGRTALKSWQTLLQKHPEYPDRQKVEQLMQQVQTALKQAGGSLGFQQ